MDRPANRRSTKLPPTPSETRPMCACGLSRAFPFCDGSQMITKTNIRGELVGCGTTDTSGSLQGQRRP